jgi:hypothetical protein
MHKGVIILITKGFAPKDNGTISANKSPQRLQSQELQMPLIVPHHLSFLL